MEDEEELSNSADVFQIAELLGVPSEGSSADDDASQGARCRTPAPTLPLPRLHAPAASFLTLMINFVMFLTD